MGAVFGFFMGSLSQISTPMMTGVAPPSSGPKSTVLGEVSVFFEWSL